MTTFSEYWDKKSQKRRKSWAAKAKRFAERHMQLAEIRSEIVYSHMDRREVLSLLDEHRTVQNPIAQWDPNLHFSFSEQGLREAMKAEGADVSSLTMTVSKKTIVGQQPHEIVLIWKPAPSTTEKSLWLSIDIRICGSLLPCMNSCLASSCPSPI